MNMYRGRPGNVSEIEDCGYYNLPFSSAVHHPNSSGHVLEKFRSKFEVFDDYDDYYYYYYYDDEHYWC